VADPKDEEAFRDTGLRRRPDFDPSLVPTVSEAQQPAANSPGDSYSHRAGSTWSEAETAGPDQAPVAM
jgi:hypothetical protein